MTGRRVQGRPGLRLPVKVHFRATRLRCQRKIVAGGYWEHLRPPAALDQPRQRRKPEPVGVTPLRPDTELTSTHLVLVTQHQ
ncbi:hypothetical protein [Nonomuraea sp. NPDC003709]|uniref:hypothetical protein n=1 Tax=Nonomuraea sp. NPDC003709 TaxID=3154450 RepID=UPI0033AF0728